MVVTHFGRKRGRRLHFGLLPARQGPLLNGVSTEPCIPAHPISVGFFGHLAVVRELCTSRTSSGRHSRKRCSNRKHGGWSPSKASISSIKAEGLESPSVRKSRSWDAHSCTLRPNVSKRRVFSASYLLLIAD